MVFFRRKNAPMRFNQARLRKPYAKQLRLGEGTYAVVYKVMDEDGGIFAMKEEAIQNAGDFANESQLLTLLRHPNIVSLFDYGVEGDKHVLILEFVGGGSLARVISQCRQPMPELTIRNYTRQILTALEYCHSFGVVHRDIKASNILVTENGRLKLADFGGSKRGPTKVTEAALKASQPMQMTLLWAAPEQLRDFYTCKSDIWSLGCTMLEMATLQRPWAGVNFENAMAVTYFLMQQTTGPAIPTHLSKEAQDFMSKCFTMDYTSRPSASELLQHPWFHPEGVLSLGTLSAGSATNSATNSGTNSMVDSMASTASSAVGPASVDKEQAQGPSDTPDSPVMDKLTLSDFRKVIGDTNGPVKISWLDTLETTRAAKNMTLDSVYTPVKRITEEEMLAAMEAEEARVRGS